MYEKINRKLCYLDSLTDEDKIIKLSDRIYYTIRTAYELGDISGKQHNRLIYRLYKKLKNYDSIIFLTCEGSIFKRYD